jgi:hypothetical protein
MSHQMIATFPAPNGWIDDYTDRPHCQSYTEQYQHNRQDSRLLRPKSVGRKMACERGKEEDKTSPLFSFSQILVLLLVVNNSNLNI